MRVAHDWNHYTYVYGEGREARVDFDVEAAVLPTEPGVTGLRVRAAVGALDRDGLAALLPAEAWLVGVLTYAEQVEFVVQLPVVFDPQPLVDAGLTVETTRGWDYFNDRVCPTPADWRRIQDRETIERLDLDGDGEVRVLHRFYGDAPALERIRARLADEAFEHVADDATHLTLAHTHPIDDISRITLGLMRLGERLGVAYDGWVLPG